MLLAFLYANPSLFGVMFLVKPFTVARLITMFITRQPTQSREFPRNKQQQQQRQPVQANLPAMRAFGAGFGNVI